MITAAERRENNDKKKTKNILRVNFVGIRSQQTQQFPHSITLAVKLNFHKVGIYSMLNTEIYTPWVVFHLNFEQSSHRLQPAFIKCRFCRKGVD